MRTPLFSLSLLLNAPEYEQDNCLIMAIFSRRCYFGSDQMRTHKHIMIGKWKIYFSIRFAKGFNFIFFVLVIALDFQHSAIIPYSGGARIKGNEQIIKIISIIINYCGNGSLLRTYIPRINVVT